MNPAAAGAVARERSPLGVALVAGIVVAALTEGMAGTAVMLAQGDLLGDTHATPDELAWLEIAYIACKLTGFMAASWLMCRVDSRRLLVASTLCMGAACGLAAMTSRLDFLVLLRSLQGFSGGTLLVVGQAMLFLVQPAARQPTVQALFAIGAVVAPATIAPALQGWMVETHAWTWIFLSVVPLALLAGGLLLVADAPAQQTTGRRKLDASGLLLVCVALFCFTYVLSRGSRWDWFEAPRIQWLTIIGIASLLGFLGRLVLAGGNGLIGATLFKSDDFSFAFLVSFVAGAALFGSAFLIPSFAVSVLAFTPLAAGHLLLPGSLFFVGALLLAAFCFQRRRVPPFASVPFGILMIMGAMWLLSGSTSESGSPDMLAALLWRGAGLGFLFLSITLIAFGQLHRRDLAIGIGLFNAGRQLGGLVGVAALQTLIERNVAGNVATLGAHVAAGTSAVDERMASTIAGLIEGGMNVALATRAATGLFGRAVAEQATVIAYNSAFNSIALLFIFAAPVLVGIKIGLARRARLRAAMAPA